MATEAGVHLDALLRTDEVLAAGELIAPVVRGTADLRLRMRCGRPLLYPVAVEDLPAPLRSRAGATGARYLGAVFAFDLDEAPAGYRYAAAAFAVDLDDPETVAVRVHTGGDQFGLLDGPGSELVAASPLAGRAGAALAGRPALLNRLRLRTDRPAARTTGELSPVFGWAYLDRRTAPILPRSYGVHALLEVPPGRTALRGNLEATVEVTGRLRRRAALAQRIPFTVPLPGAPAEPSAAVRLCMAADVVGYSRRGAAGAELLQRDLVRVLARTRAAAGIAEADVTPQPQGDGQFTVLPVGLDESAVIPRLIDGLGAALAERNAAEPREEMRLRFALHRGLVKEADNGWVGRAPVAVHRLLDSPPVRAALREHPEAGFVLAVPDVLFADVVAETPQAPAFRPITVEIPAKNFVEQAWLYVPPVAG
jgi:hypothetical protein